MTGNPMSVVLDIDRGACWTLMQSRTEAGEVADGSKAAAQDCHTAPGLLEELVGHRER